MKSFLAVLGFFLEHPLDEVYLRELAKRLKLSPFATKGHCDLLLQEGLILERRSANLRYFRANREGVLYRQYKKTHALGKLLRTGVVDYLRQRMPSIVAIVLYGSLAKGTDTQESDIDLLLIGHGKLPDLSEFGDIEPHLFSWAQWQKQSSDNSAYYEDVILHGIPLYGEMPVVR